MAAFKNDFSWSVSRDKTFRGCLRQYYYQYYAFWNGWKESADPRTRLIYVLKNLDTRQTWAGSRVHECIEHTLKNLRRGVAVLPLEQIIDLTIKEMRNDFRNSKNGGYRQVPKSCGLVEHEYQIDVPDDVWRDNATLVRKCLETFYHSAIFSEIKSLQSDEWLEIEEFSHFSFDGVKIWAVMDVAYRHGSQIKIIDWKTGRANLRDNSAQLACYALYASQKWKIKAADLITVEFNLQHNQIQDFRVSDDVIENVKSIMQGSIADMKSMLKDPNHNVPKDESAFTLADDDEPCQFCNFRRVCPRFADHFKS